MPPSTALSSRSSSPTGRFVCAWCEDELREDAREGAGSREPTDNFGLCSSCLDAQLARLRARKPARTAPRSRSKASLRAAQ
jgi:hypothetical protein